MTAMFPILFRFSSLSSLVAAIWLQTISCVLADARIGGRVHEFGTSEPIGQADVQVFTVPKEEWDELRTGKKLVDKKRSPDLADKTKLDGTYLFDSVTGTHAVLRVKHVGFVRNPTDKYLVLDKEYKIDVPLIDNAKVDVSAPNIQYVAAVVTELDRIFGESATKQQLKWDAIGGFNLPVPSKRLFAIEFARRNPAIMDQVPAVKGYVNSDPKALKRAAKIWSEGVDEKGFTLPAAGSLDGIDSAVEADIFVNLLRNTSVDSEKRAVLVHKFNERRNANFKLNLETLNARILDERDKLF